MMMKVLISILSVFLSYIAGSAQETLMQTDASPISVVKIDFRINKPVENGLYKYLVNI